MEDSVFRLQQAARQRVLAAQERSRRLVEQAEHRPRPDPIDPPGPTPPKPTPPAAEPDDRLLLLLLAFFLYRNGAPSEVLLALLYLAL